MAAAGAYLADHQVLVADAATYLRAVLGTGTGQGLREAPEARARDNLRAEETRLAAARSDRSLSVVERYALFHRVTGAQPHLPEPLQSLAPMADALRLMPEAQGSLTRRDAAPATDLQAFVTAAAAVQHAAAAPSA